MLGLLGTLLTMHLLRSPTVQPADAVGDASDTAPALVGNTSLEADST